MELGYLCAGLGELVCVLTGLTLVPLWSAQLLISLYSVILIHYFLVSTFRLQYCFGCTLMFISVPVFLYQIRFEMCTMVTWLLLTLLVRGVKLEITELTTSVLQNILVEICLNVPHLIILSLSIFHKFNLESGVKVSVLVRKRVINE